MYNNNESNFWVRELNKKIANGASLDELEALQTTFIKQQGLHIEKLSGINPKK